MTERERLIELLKKAFEIGSNGRSINLNVDYLIANGVVVLPCKIGDTFYYLGQRAITGALEVCEGQASSIEYDDAGCTIYEYSGMDFNQKDIFFTREEAEMARKEETYHG